MLHELIASAQQLVAQRLNEQYIISPNSIVVDVEDMCIVDLPGWIYGAGQQAAQTADAKRFKIYNHLLELFATSAPAQHNIAAWQG